MNAIPKSCVVVGATACLARKFQFRLICLRQRVRQAVTPTDYLLILHRDANLIGCLDEVAARINQAQPQLVRSIGETRRRQNFKLPINDLIAPGLP